MEEFGFNPDLVLEREEVAYLAALVSQPGFKILQKIFRSGVDQFAVQMINADQKNEKEVLARHNAARTAAQFYTWVVNSINNEVQEYIHSAPNDKPIQSAENIDIGEYTSEETITEEEPW